MAQLEVGLTNGRKLVVDVYGAEPGCCNDEISISIIDKDGVYLQDIAIVRESLSEDNIIEAMIFADEENEDYTEKFCIKQYDGQYNEAITVGGII